MSLPPDPKAVPEHSEDVPPVANRGVSATKPAEGADDVAAEQPGSPEG